MLHASEMDIATTEDKPKASLTNMTLQKVDSILHRFRNSMDENERIDYKTFKNMLNNKNDYFTDRVFKLLNTDNSGKISLDEYVGSLLDVLKKGPEDRLGFLFKIFDTNNDGRIAISELAQILNACAAENEIEFSNEEIYDLTTLLMDDFDPEFSGGINQETLVHNMKKRPDLLLGLSQSLEQWLLPPIPGKQRSRFEASRTKCSCGYIKNNMQSVLFLFVFLACNVALFVSRSLQFRNESIFYIFARASGQCLNFTSAFSIVLMLRRIFTWLRDKGIASYLPVDEFIYFHKLTGCFIFFYAILHTVMHVCNFSLSAMTYVSVHQNYSDFVNGSTASKSGFTMKEYLFTTKPNIGWLNGSACLTGWILLILLILIVFTAHPWVRRSHMFEVFFFTHLLFIPFYIFLLLHGPSFWIWFIIPFILYSFESLIRVWESHGRRGKTNVSQAALLPGKVTHLIINRPSNFNYNPGDYLFLNIPTIANYEWHPFTISSAPEMQDYLSVHIRAVGQWTRSLYEYFEESIKDKRVHSRRASHFHRPLRRLGRQVTKRLVSFGDSVRIRRQVSTDPLARVETYKKTSGDNMADDLSPIVNFVLDSQDFDRKRVGKSFSVNFHPGDHNRKLPENSPVSLNSVEVNGGMINPAFDHKRIEMTKSSPACSTLGSRTERRFQLTRMLANTSKLIEIPENRMADLDGKVISTTVGKETLIKWPEQIPVYVAGPFGSPSSEIFQSEHAVLIGTGIGVTPYASILQSIMHRYGEAKSRCPKCDYCWLDPTRRNLMHLKKVDFFWINRSHKSFGWFVNLLRQLELQESELYPLPDNRRFLDLHMYITSALDKANVKAILLQMALELMHKKAERDLITGLQTQTNPGRPNWDKVFTKLRDERVGKVTVFYCGPPQLGTIIRRKCIDFGFGFKKEKF